MLDGHKLYAIVIKTKNDMSSILVDINNTAFAFRFRDFGRGSHFAVLRTDQSARSHTISDALISTRTYRQLLKSIKPAQKRQARSQVLIRNLTNPPKN